MGRYMIAPVPRITLNSVVLNRGTYTTVTRRENGIDLGTINYVDSEGGGWSSVFNAGNSVLIEVKDSKETNYTTLLRGLLRPAVSPELPNDIVRLKCQGNGRGLDAMKVAAEYGSQVSASLDEIDEIVDDIVDNYVEKIFASATSSAYTMDTEIDAATLTETARYMSFPYIEAYKAINSALEIFQGVRGTNAGAHWVVHTGATPKLYVQRIADHSAQAKTDGWTNYLGGNDASTATFIQGQDFINFNCTKSAREANYVLYYGAWKHPCPIDVYTEDNSADWDGVELVSGNPLTIADDAVTYLYGAKSIKTTAEAGIGGGEGARVWYPDSYDLGLDITKVGGKYNLPAINMLLLPDANVGVTTPAGGVAPYLILGTGDPANGDWFVRTIPTMQSATWNKITLPIGPYSDWFTAGLGAPDWASIDFVGVEYYNINAGAGIMNIDGLHFSGYVARVAKQAAIYLSGGGECLMKIVTDDYGKDDVIADGDKTGTISKLAYAEYLRCSSNPTTGTFTTGLVKDVWPGQLIHVHAKKRYDGTFRIDSDFRVTEVTHVIGDKCLTHWTVTSDVVNCHSQPAYNSINKNLASVRPGTQDMQATSMNMREIDITQPRLVNTY